MSKTKAMLKVEKQIGEDIKRYLCRKYYSENLTTREIGELLGYSTSGVTAWCKKLDIPLRTNAESSKIRYSKTTLEQRKAITASANERTREMIKAGEFWLEGAKFGEDNIAKRPEVRKKISDCRKVDNPMFKEEHRVKMRRSMEGYLRTRATSHELLLMKKLGNFGYYPKFQHAVCRAILDFAFIDLKIGIEVDGVTHMVFPNTREKDKSRDEELDREGWIILRFFNSEIENDLGGCLREIIEVVEANKRIVSEKKAVI